MKTAMKVDGFSAALWHKLVEMVLHVGKGAKFGLKKVNSGQNICSSDDSVGNQKNV